MPRSPKRRAAARGLDARLRLQHPSCQRETLHSQQLSSIKKFIDSDHGIYRDRRQFITPFGDAMRATSTIPIGSSQRAVPGL